MTRDAEPPPDNGRIVAIWLRPGARLPVRAVKHATAVAGVGLVGDHAVGGKRQVTLLDAARWADACDELQRRIDPAFRRANLLLEGIDLAASIGRSLRLGAVVVDVRGETRPCELLDGRDGDGRLGLAASLRRDRRGGVFGTIRTGGELHVGDRVELLPRA